VADKKFTPLEEREDGIWDAESGELVEWPEDKSRASFIAEQFLKFKKEAGNFERDRLKWQDLLIRKMGEDRMLPLGDQTLGIRRDRLTRFQPDWFRRNLTGQELTHDDKNQILACVSGFSADAVAKLPIYLRKLIQEAYSEGEKAPFIDVT
jgi:hypothetical protein